MDLLTIPKKTWFNCTHIRVERKPAALGPGVHLSEGEGVGSAAGGGGRCRPPSCSRTTARSLYQHARCESRTARKQTKQKLPEAECRRLVSAQHRTAQRSEHVGASSARVRVREAVQRGWSHPMDAGELVRLRRINATFCASFFFNPTSLHNGVIQQIHCRRAEPRLLRTCMRLVSC